MRLEKYTLGVGDRFERRGVAQLAAVRDSRRPFVGGIFFEQDRPLDEEAVEEFLGAYALAIREAGKIYRYAKPLFLGP